MIRAGLLLALVGLLAGCAGGGRAALMRQHGLEACEVVAVGPAAALLACAHGPVVLFDDGRVRPLVP